MKKSVLIFAAWFALLSNGSGQGLEYKKLWIHPSTHLVSTGNTHIVLQNTNFENDGMFEPGTGSVHFTGDQSDSLLGDSRSRFFNLVINKAVGVNIFIPPELPIDGPWSIDNRLIFAGTDNRVILSIRDLILSSGARILGAGPQNFVVTLQSGQLVKEGLVDFIFPIGHQVNHYNPLRIESPVPVTLGVLGLPHTYSNGTYGRELQKGVIDISWQIAKPQGVVSNLSLTAQWNSWDELPGFNATDCGISKCLGSGDWDLAGSDIGSKSGQGPFTISRQGIQLTDNDNGVFTVGSEPVMYPLRIQLRAILQGAFNLASGMMDAHLAGDFCLPYREPYSNLQGFTHVGRGGGESVSPNVLGKTGPDAIVDWVFLELRSKTNPSMVLETRSALIQRNGFVVDTDGISVPVFRGREAGDYFFSIRHRNHLGVRSVASSFLAHQPVEDYDFTTGQNQAFQGVQAFLGPNAGWAMYGGNANGDGMIRYSGPNNDQNSLLNNCLGGSKIRVVNKTYSACDLNLDCKVRYSGPNNDQNFLLNTVLGGDRNKVIIQPAF